MSFASAFKSVVGHMVKASCAFMKEWGALISPQNAVTKVKELIDITTRTAHSTPQG